MPELKCILFPSEEVLVPELKCILFPCEEVSVPELKCILFPSEEVSVPELKKALPPELFSMLILKRQAHEIAATGKFFISPLEVTGDCGL